MESLTLGTSECDSWPPRVLPLGTLARALCPSFLERHWPPLLNQRCDTAAPQGRLGRAGVPAGTAVAIWDPRIRASVYPPSRPAGGAGVVPAGCHRALRRGDAAWPESLAAAAGVPGAGAHAARRALLPGLASRGERTRVLRATTRRAGALRMPGGGAGSGRSPELGRGLCAGRAWASGGGVAWRAELEGRGVLRAGGTGTK